MNGQLTLPDAALPNLSHRPGVYHLMRGTQVVYIGQSANVLGRIASHTADSYDVARIFLCELEQLNQIERQHIEWFKPLRNRQGQQRPQVPTSNSHERILSGRMRGGCMIAPPNRKRRGISSAPDTAYLWVTYRSMCPHD